MAMMFNTWSQLVTAGHNWSPPGHNKIFFEIFSKVAGNCLNRKNMKKNLDKIFSPFRPLLGLSQFSPKCRYHKNGKIVSLTSLTLIFTAKIRQMSTKSSVFFSNLRQFLACISAVPQPIRPKLSPDRAPTSHDNHIKFQPDRPR